MSWGSFLNMVMGGADVKPIVHLFKSQVFQIAEYLEVPEHIRKRIPTTVTYSAEQAQAEFFFTVPFEILDSVCFGWEQGVTQSKLQLHLN